MSTQNCKTFTNTIGVRSGTKLINAESRKAVSRALKTIYRETLPAPANAASDAFTLPVSSTSGCVSAQMRVGNLYFPLQPITAPLLANGNPDPVSGAVELANQFSLVFPKGLLSQTTYTTINPCIGTSLERDSGTLQLAGVPLSNSRSLQLMATFADTGEKRTNFFLQFTTLVRVFLNQVTCEV